MIRPPLQDLLEIKARFLAPPAMRHYGAPAKTQSVMEFRDISNTQATSLLFNCMVVTILIMGTSFLFLSLETCRGARPPAVVEGLKGPKRSIDHCCHHTIPLAPSGFSWVSIR